MKEDPVIHQREWRWKGVRRPEQAWFVLVTGADGGSKPHLYYICPKSSDFSVQSLWWNHYPYCCHCCSVIMCRRLKTLSELGTSNNHRQPLTASKKLYQFPLHLHQLSEQSDDQQETWPPCEQTDQFKQDASQDVLAKMFRRARRLSSSAPKLSILKMIC